MAASAQPAPVEQVVEDLDQLPTEEKQEILDELNPDKLPDIEDIESFNEAKEEESVEEAIKRTPLSPQAKAAKKHIEDLAKKNNKSFGDQRMHIDDFPGKHDKKTQAAAKALNKHQYGQYGEEVDKGFAQRMKAADAAANSYSKEKRKPDNREIDKIRAKYRDQKKNQSQSEEVEQVDEKILTPAEKKKREEIAQAISRDDPKMPMDKKMAIATAQAKKVAESVSDRTKELIERAINRKT
jgi:hypothetical protein